MYQKMPPVSDRETVLGCSLYQSLEVLLSRLLSGLKTLSEQYHKITITDDMRLDILWWYTYIREFNGVSFISDPAIITKTHAGVPARLAGEDTMARSTGAECFLTPCWETALLFTRKSFGS